MAAIEPLGIDPLDFDPLGLDRGCDPPETSDWMQHAACRGETQLFFPPRAERPQARVRREAQARRLCLQCIVADSCRAFARTHREYGFWGGESEEARVSAGFRTRMPRAARRPRRINPHRVA